MSDKNLIFPCMARINGEVIAEDIEIPFQKDENTTKQNAKSVFKKKYGIEPEMILGPFFKAVDCWPDGDLIQSLDQIEKELFATEKQLAAQFNIPLENIRHELIAKNKNNQLPEDELVAKWLELLTVYNDWVKNAEKTSSG